MVGKNKQGSKWDSVSERWEKINKTKMEGLCINVRVCKVVIIVAQDAMKDEG